MARSVNEVLFEAVKNKLQTARESYAVGISSHRPIIPLKVICMMASRKSVRLCKRS